MNSSEVASTTENPSVVNSSGDSDSRCANKSELDVVNANKGLAEPTQPDPSTTLEPPTENSSGDLDPRCAKKPRLELNVVNTNKGLVEPTQPDPLTTLPVELLAEILKLTDSPRDILAVARCSKYLCATLVNPASNFIWRATRQTCKPAPLPDPTPNFTEAAYAAFVFDGGICEVCKKRTKAMYVSFALRIRLCPKPECRNAFARGSLVDASLSFHGNSLWIPSVESEKCFAPTKQPYHTWPSSGNFWVRSTDWQNFLSDQRLFSTEPVSPEIMKKCRRQIEQTPHIMKFAVDLSEWKSKYDHAYAAIKAKNDLKMRILAQREGWEVHDLLHCEAYGHMHRRMTNIFEEIKPSDVSAIQVEMEAQLLNIVERRKRRIEEESFRRRRADVEQHYNRLKSAGELVLPTLAEFRKLPTMQVVVGKVSSASLGVSTELKNSVLFGEMIREDLRKWMEPVRDILSHQLGAAQWKTASKTRLHPLDRITARFTCKKCDKVAKKYTADGCLDFRGVCSHQCPHLDKKAAESYVWSADQFVKDEKVTAVISQVLELCGADEQHRDASAVVHAVGPRFRCLTCKMLMDFRSVIGHAQRHDHMKVELVPNNESNPYTFQFGLSVKLLDLGRKAAKMRALQNYRCCHCAVQSAPRDVAATNVTSQASAIAPGDKAEPLRLQSAKEVKLFDFNALRSHVKAKHNIEHIRDEDFSCHSPLDWATSYPKLQSRDRRKI